MKEPLSCANSLTGPYLNAGATIVKPTQETFWGGYACYFQNPDGHLWEVVWNPQLIPEDKGAASRDSGRIAGGLAGD